ncbi:acetyltransferase [Alteribacter populi]|uniref:acetyltransferase n=1 Tax=Alteribacter populi TaxID=2011011 RepID=UPI000BBAE5EB|nr:acetyltransferase [Alteribacter populi]
MKIIIIGQGGHSKVIKDMILEKDEFEIVGYLDDVYKELVFNEDFFYGPISSLQEVILYYGAVKIVIAIGDNKVRKMIAERLDLPLAHYATLIHKLAVISPSAELGCGTVVMSNAVVNADTKIGDHTIINTSAVIEHDNSVGSFVHISPNATLTGSVKVEEGVHVGAGAIIIPNIKIGAGSIIGAGATVIKDVPPCCTAVGVPAKYKMREGDTIVENNI